MKLNEKFLAAVIAAALISPAAFAKSGPIMRKASAGHIRVAPTVRGTDAIPAPTLTKKTRTKKSKHKSHAKNQKPNRPVRPKV